MKASAADYDVAVIPQTALSCRLRRALRRAHFSAGYIQDARVLNDVIGLLADEIAVLDKAIAAGLQP